MTREIRHIAGHDKHRNATWVRIVSPTAAQISPSHEAGRATQLGFVMSSCGAWSRLVVDIERVDDRRRHERDLPCDSRVRASNGAVGLWQGPHQERECD
jgi:hypothetical protein